MRIITSISLCAMALGAATPALAQDAMMKDGAKPHGEMKMSDAEMKKMKACNAMSHEMMMKDSDCVKMMKMHPDMMKHDTMMKDDHMMKDGK